MVAVYGELWATCSGSQRLRPISRFKGAGSNYGLRSDGTYGYYDMVVHSSCLHVARKTGVDLNELPLAHASGEHRCESMCVWRFLVGIMVSGVGARLLCMARLGGQYGAGLVDSYKSPVCIGDVLVESCSSERADSLK
jgi:hypothetical protein